MELMIFVGLILYFLPAGIAMLRYHHNRVAICLCNLLFGWTILGWGITLIWAATAVRHEVRPIPPVLPAPVVPSVPRPTHRNCPTCGKPCRWDADICTGCRTVFAAGKELLSCSR